MCKHIYVPFSSVASCIVIPAAILHEITHIQQCFPSMPVLQFCCKSCSSPKLQQHRLNYYLVEIASVCLPIVEKRSVLDISAVGAHATVNKMTIMTAKFSILIKLARVNFIGLVSPAFVYIVASHGAHTPLDISCIQVLD